jgi:PAS domain S-box-containing protein
MARLRSGLARYGLALAATTLASLLHLISGAPEVDSDVMYFGFTGAVLVSSVLAGFGPGLVATALSVFASVYFFLSPVFSLEVASDARMASLILFAGEGILLSFVGRILHDADTTDAVSPWTMRYAPALLFVSTATGLKLLAFTELGQMLPFTFFYAAIAASGCLGGFGPGLLATLLASLSARYFFLPPRYSLSVLSSITAVRVGVFILEGILISALSAKYPKARRITGHAIDQMRQYAERVRRSREDIRALRLTTKDVIWEWDTTANRMVRGTTEMERPETATAAMSLGAWLQQIHPEDRSEVAASLTTALRQGRDEWLCEYRRLRPGGALADISEHAYIIRDSHGNPVRLVGRSADITEAKQAAQIHGAARQYRAVFDQSPLAILLTDDVLNVMKANRAASDVFGYSSAQFTDMHVEQLVDERRRNAVKEALLGLARIGRSTITLEESCLRADGELFPAKVNAAIVSDVGDGSPGWVIMIEKVAG